MGNEAEDYEPQFFPDSDVGIWKDVVVPAESLDGKASKNAQRKEAKNFALAEMAGKGWQPQNERLIHAVKRKKGWVVAGRWLRVP